MSTANRNRRARIRGFMRRATISPADVQSHGDWRFIAIHPFADDAETLARIGIAPADCVSADAWLCTGGDEILLQISGSAGPSNGVPRPSLFATWWGSPPYLQIHADVAESQVTSDVVKNVLNEIARAGIRAPDSAADGILRRLCWETNTQCGNGDAIEGTSPLPGSVAAFPRRIAQYPNDASCERLLDFAVTRDWL